MPGRSLQAPSSLHRIPYQFFIFMQDGSARPCNAKKRAFEPRRLAGLLLPLEQIHEWWEGKRDAQRKQNERDEGNPPKRYGFPVPLARQHQP